MAKIKIGENRTIELLTEKKNPNARHIKIGNFFGELTEDKKQTNGTPLLKLAKDGKNYYIREKYSDYSISVKLKYNNYPDKFVSVEINDFGKNEIGKAFEAHVYPKGTNPYFSEFPYYITASSSINNGVYNNNPKIILKDGFYEIKIYDQSKILLTTYIIQVIQEKGYMRITGVLSSYFRENVDFSKNKIEEGTAEINYINADKILIDKSNIKLSTNFNDDKNGYSPYGMMIFKYPNIMFYGEIYVADNFYYCIWEFEIKDISKTLLISKCRVYDDGIKSRIEAINNNWNSSVNGINMFNIEKTEVYWLLK